MTISGHPMTVVEQEDRTLKLQGVGHNPVIEDTVEQEDFLPYLKAYIWEWLWDNIQTPAGTEWIM